MSDGDKRMRIEHHRFEYVFQEHPADKFLSRPHISDRMCWLVEDNSSDSPYVFLVGESGTGKSALLIDFITRSKTRPVYYFLEHNNEINLDPCTFICNLFHRLSHLDAESYGALPYSHISDRCAALQMRINSISENCLNPGDIQVIVIDSLDLAEVFSRTAGTYTIIDVLNNLRFPANFRILVSTSHLIDAMQRYESHDNANIVWLSEQERKCTKDVLRYLTTYFPAARVNIRKVRRLATIAKGNYQYAASVVELASEEGVDVQWLLDNPPISLDAIYRIKLQRIARLIDSEQTLSDLWSVMRLISAMPSSHKPHLFWDILKLDYANFDNIVVALKRFFDLRVFRETNQCRWFHSSFVLFIRHQTSADEFANLYMRIGRYVEEEIERGYADKLPPSLLSYLDCRYAVEDDSETLLKWAEKYFDHIAETDAYVKNGSLWIFSFACFSAAISSRSSSRHILLFGFMTYALDSAMPNDVSSTVIRPFSKDHDISSAEDIIPLYDVSSLLLDHGKRKEAIRAGIWSQYECKVVPSAFWMNQPETEDEARIEATEALRVFQSGSLDWFILQNWLYTVFLSVHGSLKQKGNVWKESKRYACQWLPPEDTTIAPEQTSVEVDDQGLKIKYDNGPIVIYKGEPLDRFHGSELSFAMLLNLAARRKSNNPREGLAHKETDLLDISQGFKNFDNLRNRLPHHKGHHPIQPHRTKAGRLAKDKRVYLKLDGRNIDIEESIREFSSTHRKELRALLKDDKNIRLKQVEVDDYCYRLRETLRFLERNESLVDDAIERLGYEQRSIDSIKELEEIKAHSQAILKRLDNTHYS